jgi:hypothetical protein
MSELERPSEILSPSYLTAKEEIQVLFPTGLFQNNFHSDAQNSYYLPETFTFAQEFFLQFHIIGFI